MEPGKKIDFSTEIFEKCRFLQAISLKNFDFSRQISPKFPFFRKFKTNFEFPSKNWPFTETSWQIILFLFKSHHFRTYFLYMIRYNNNSRPVYDTTTPLRPPSATPHDPPAQNLEGRDPHPNPQDWRPWEEDWRRRRSLKLSSFLRSSVGSINNSSNRTKNNVITTIIILVMRVLCTTAIRHHDNSSTDISSTTLRLQTFRLQIFRLLWLSLLKIEAGVMKQILYQ